MPQLNFVADRRLAPHVLIVLALISIACAALPAGAAEDGEVEEAGNNLSVPVLFGEGIGLAGADVALAPENTGLRGLPGIERFDGAFWYWWPTDAGGASCDPSGPSCPPSPAPAGLEQVFVQQDDANEWQADWADGRALETPLVVDDVDWGDNLESQVWNTQSMVRAEIVLLKDVELTGYEMRYLAGKGPGEVHGTNTNPIASPQATVFSPCARLTIQKLQRDSGSLDAPLPVEALRWDAAAAEWEWTGAGSAATVFNSAVWERFGVDGPVDAYGAEVNVGGRTIYGYLWRVGSSVLPQGFDKGGWYRLTFSLDGTTTTTAAPPRACGSFSLNTSLRNATIVVPVEEDDDDEEGPPDDRGGRRIIAIPKGRTTAYATTQAEDGDTGETSRPGFHPVVDAVNNLTYVDVFIRERSMGGGNRPPRPIGRPGGRGGVPVVPGRR